MKQDNKDIFDIDFNNKCNSATSKKDNNNADFFNFSVSNKKVTNDKPRFHEEFSKEEPTIEEIAPVVEVEVTPAPVQDEITIVEEEPVAEDTPASEDTLVVEAPASEEQAPKTEIPSPAITSVPEKSTTDIDEENVSITKVNWRKKTTTTTNAQLYSKSNASPSTAPAETPAKKKSIVIETDDGFEIKICSFRDLANK